MQKAVEMNEENLPGHYLIILQKELLNLIEFWQRRKTYSFCADFFSRRFVKMASPLMRHAVE